MNDKLIAEARGLCSQATPGPWTRTGTESHIIDSKPDEKYGIVGIVCEVWNHADAALIARSRTLVPELANALEAAEKQIPRWMPVDEDSDELPYDDGSQQDVLCYFADGEIQTFNLYEIREWNKSRRDTGKNGDVATHYMPLPKGAEDKE